MSKYQLPYEIHEQLRTELSEERAKKIAVLLQNSIDTVFNSAKDLAVLKKLELKDELSKELVTKTEFHAEFKLVRSEIKLYFFILIGLMILLNKDSLVFIVQLLGLMK
jgi:arsenate reductase-like glutaredoxin family protein